MNSPPVTTNAPAPPTVASVLLLAVIMPPTFNAPAIPAPPATVNAPELLEVDA